MASLIINFSLSITYKEQLHLVCATIIANWGNVIDLQP